MKDLDCAECKVHVLVCTNERPAPKTGCKDFGGQEFYSSLKTKLKETGLYATHWITRTGCLGFCNQVGTTVVIQPAGKPAQWYSEVTAADFDFIWNEITKARE
jgi:(2Fe-2S) ferredoxin